ncbi:hypothetical protein BH24GEM3_BH24GEM3_09730 [soil metagenome]|jgi:hypothetical protein
MSTILQERLTGTGRDVLRGRFHEGAIEAVYRELLEGG